jgi:4-hydroxy-3-polyprenylbenzoate decarboxylase
MAYDGLADFVSALEARGELMRVTAQVSPHLEVAAIADRVMKAGGPALLFERVGESRFPLLINAYGSRARMSLALGADDLDQAARAVESLLAIRPSLSWSGLVDLASSLPDLGHVPPRRVAEGPCQQVVLEGDAVDLGALPVCTSWPGDGGAFLTLPCVITRDPDTGARNVGMYRMQIFDRRTTGMHWQVHKTGARHFRRARELGMRRLEVAVSLGGDPVLAYAASAPLPDGVDEWMLAGLLRRVAVRTVRARTVDLDVPADADFVLEGFVDTEEPLVDEGPFGDHTGYYTPVGKFPRFHVTCITHRRDAVYPCTLVGPPPMEDAWLGKASERIFLPLLRSVVPEIVDVNMPVEGAFHNLVLVSIRKQFPMHAHRVAHALWGLGQMSSAKVICVVDDDVDVQCEADVAWRLLANVDPRRDVGFVDGPLDELDHGSSRPLVGSKMLVDGTRKWPEEGYERVWPEVLKTAPETQAQVEARWSELGLDPSWLAPRGPWAHGRRSADDDAAGLAGSVMRAARTWLRRRG